MSLLPSIYGYNFQDMETFALQSLVRNICNLQLQPNAQTFEIYGRGVYVRNKKTYLINYNTKKNCSVKNFLSIAEPPLLKPPICLDFKFMFVGHLLDLFNILNTYNGPWRCAHNCVGLIYLLILFVIKIVYTRMIEFKSI